MALLCPGPKPWRWSGEQRTDSPLSDLRVQRLLGVNTHRAQLGPQSMQETPTTRAEMQVTVIKLLFWVTVQNQEFFQPFSTTYKGITAYKRNMALAPV